MQVANSIHIHFSSKNGRTHPRTYLRHVANRPTRLCHPYISIHPSCLLPRPPPWLRLFGYPLSSVPLGTRRPQPPSISLLSFLVRILWTSGDHRLRRCHKFFSKLFLIFFLPQVILLLLLAFLYVNREGQHQCANGAASSTKQCLPQGQSLTTSFIVSISHPTPCDVDVRFVFLVLAVMIGGRAISELQYFQATVIV